nr:RNA-directed DNA polymerase, eukaryota, reverse transcriptase zinc-binding domain protein [Tanacetum cinerariifolium]
MELVFLRISSTKALRSLVVLLCTHLLSKWKVKTLSIGGRLTLLKSVLGAIPLYTLSIYKAPKGVLHEMEMIRNNFFNGADSADRKITWVAWDKVLASKKYGGLGVSSYYALNHALLLKWVWRSLSQDGSLWSRVINAIYGSSIEYQPSNISSCWSSILREVQVLISKGFDFLSHCKIRVGNGLNTRFWLDTWIMDLPLSIRFPRIYVLERIKEVSVAAKWGASSFDESFRRQVRDGVEANNDIRSYLDDLFLPSLNEATRWVKYVPIKVNVFAWRARLDRLPTRDNLAKRGVNMVSTLCPVCDSFLEDVQHLFLDATWLNLSSKEFAVGGISIGLMFRHLSSGILGSLLFGCQVSLNRYWKEFLSRLGGLFGLSGTGLFLTSLFLGVQ